MAQTLKEKLEALKKKQLALAASTLPAPVIVPQCSCGGALEGECPECNPPEEPAILERLQVIGAKVGVNPPPDDTPPIDKMPCPYCDGEFKHLSRHKCKKQPEGAASPAEAVELAQMAERGELPTTTHAAEKERCFPTAPPAEEAPVTRAAHTEDKPDPGPGYFIALVDVLPLRDTEAPMVVFEDIIAPLADSVAKTNQVPHWKMVDYGKGAGQLARLLEDFLKAKQPQGFLLCSSATAEFQACRAVVTRLARNVMMGVR